MNEETVVIVNEQEVEPIETELKVESLEAESKEDEPLELETKEDEHESGFKKRIDRFNRRLTEKEAEIEYWKKTALEKQQSGVSPQQVNHASDKPKFENYSDIAEYTEALTDWKLQEALLRRTQEVSKQSEVQQYKSRVKEFVKEHADYDEVLQDASHIPAAQEIHQIILESEVGPQIAYHLANNIELLEKLNSLPSHRRLIELGKLEDKLTVKNEVPQVKKSSAPSPIKTEKGAAPVKRDIHDETLSQAEYRAMRAKQLAGKMR